MSRARKALVVGINHYAHGSPLFGCVEDAQKVSTILARHADQRVNFSVNSLYAADPKGPISRNDLRAKIEELFDGDNEVALFYFAGHGHLESTGGYILASDSRAGHEGVPLADVLSFADRSASQNRIIVLDSCHSGIAGTRGDDRARSELREGTTILTASTADQYATERNGAGLFTTLFVDALGGAASNLVGEITPGSVYAHIDQALGPWHQRPVFKTNVKSFVSLRTVAPPIGLTDLRRIVEFFPTSGHPYPLDPTYEPESAGRPHTAPPPNPINTEKFAVLQKMNRVNLVVPVDAPHMWHAAINRKACKLTTLGEYYRQLVEQGLI